MSVTEIPPPEVELAPGFDERLFAELVRDEPEGVRALRAAAYKAYTDLPLPTARTEEWRRTDPALFPLAEVRRQPTLQARETVVEHPWDHHFDVVVQADETGLAVAYRAPELREAGLYVATLQQAAIEHPEWLTDSDGRDQDKFEVLNAAFWNAGLFVRVPAGLEVGRGLLLRQSISEPGAALLPRLLVRAEQGSRLDLVEFNHSPDGACIQIVASKRLFLQQGAKLRVIAYQAWGDETGCIASDRAHIERDGRMDWVTLNLGGRVNKLAFSSDVAGENASAELDGLFFLNGEQHTDQRTLQIHSAPNTYSRLLYKGAVRQRAHSVYQGIIRALPGAIKVDAYQTNNNIVLDDGARADAIPGLLIDADDLKCSHGATMGNLDPAQLYYLRTRGLSLAAARRIVLMGFFEEIIHRVPYGFLRKHIRESITEKLD